MARNQKLSYKMNMNMFHFLTKQNYSKYSQISMSMLLSRFLKTSEKNAVEVKVCGKRRREVGLVIPGHYKARTKSRSHCKILDRELNYMKTNYCQILARQEEIPQKTSKNISRYFCSPFQGHV